MNQILGDEYLKERIEYVTIFTTSDDYSLAKKLLYWSIAYIKFLYYLPSADMIHVHHASDLNFWLSSVMVKVANLFNKKSLLHNHSADFHEFYNKKTNEVKTKIRKVFECASAVIVLSKSWYNWYSNIAPGATLFMLQNAIEIPEDVSPKNFAANEIILIYLARIEQRKGFFDMMDAMDEVFSQYPNAKLFVAGQGDIALAKDIVAQKGLQHKVTILGHIDSQQRDKYLRKGHILVFPSYNEGLPMSLLEAMSYGLVPVTTPVGGIPDVLIHERNGLLVKPGEKKVLAAQIKYLLDSPKNSSRLSDNARYDINEGFNYKNYGPKLMQVYDFMIKSEKSIA